jgi:hypothetical protein
MVGGSVLGWITLVSAALPPVAVAPVAAERVSLEEVRLYEQLDDLLRSAAGAAAGSSLQDEATTRANMEAVRGAGLDCAADDARCMSKVAVLAGVTRLIVPLARREGDVFRVRMLLVDGTGSSVEVEGTIPIPGNDPARVAFQRQAARSLIDVALKSPIQIAPPPPEPEKKPLTPEFLPTPPAEPAGEPLPILGLGVLGAGGLLLVGGGAGMFAMDAELATPKRFEERAGYMIAGQISLALAGVGLAAAGVGAALLVLDP